MNPEIEQDRQDSLLLAMESRFQMKRRIVDMAWYYRSTYGPIALDALLRVELYDWIYGPHVTPQSVSEAVSLVLDVHCAGDIETDASLKVIADMMAEALWV